MNIPNKIYVTLDPNGITCSDYNVHGDDLLYYSRDFIINLFSARIKEIEEEIKTINEYTMSGGQKVNRLRGIKKELKQWITTL